MDNKLISKVAVITGAAQGIGAAIARLSSLSDQQHEPDLDF